MIGADLLTKCREFCSGVSEDKMKNFEDKLRSAGIGEEQKDIILQARIPQSNLSVTLAV